MSRSLTIPKPRATQLRTIHRLLEGPLQPRQRRRAEAILLYAAGLDAQAIARLLEVHGNTIYTDLHAFQQQGVAAVQQPPATGAPPRITAAQAADICRLAETPPTQVGLPYGRWSLAKLRAYLLRRRVVRTLSREHLRRLLGKKGISFRRVRRKLVSTDPQRRAILRRLRFLWRHRRRGEILVFFDVQPITVKAYGGRRYTSARRLVLPTPQKTRGRFYLFLLYEVNRGLVHWAFLSGKGAMAVCRFMRRLRRWYPRKPVRVALDRDPAHPCKARLTRRTMRQLGLHWTTMPKGSPDDNVAETIFSDVQQMILDNSDDANSQATQRRISAHLRARNRRHDRRVKVWFLADTHKN